MRHNLLLFIILWGSVISVLWLFPHLELSKTLVTLGSLLLAGIIAALLANLTFCLLPRRLLPDLHNKAVLVTGCSSGFGLAIAKRLDALGVTVYAGLRNPQCPGAVELRETCTKNMHVLVLDVTKDEDVQHAVDYVRNTIGDKEFWAVVNNAGIGDGCLLEMTPVEMYDKVWGTNALGSVRVTKAFMPLLRRFKGRVMFVNSSLGLTATPGVLPYSMSKFALRCFGDALRREMNRWSVSVHSIYPFFYKTPITDFDKNMEKLNHLWETCPQEVREAYGEKFLLLFKKASKMILVFSSSSNIDEPVDDIIDATVGAAPRDFYVPGWKAKFYYCLENYFPGIVGDYTISFLSQGVF